MKSLLSTKKAGRAGQIVTTPKDPQRPDVMVLPADAPRTQVVKIAPILCIEVVSPEYRLPELAKRAEDYPCIGVLQTWIFNPETKKSYVFSSVGLREWNGIMRCGPIVLDPAALFAAADED